MLNFLKKFFTQNPEKPEETIITTTPGNPGHMHFNTPEEAETKIKELRAKGWTTWILPTFWPPGYVVYYYNH